MTQPALDFDTSLPISGKTPRARHASFTGARLAAEHRGAKTLEYLALLERMPLSDPKAARMMGVGVSSICSIRNACVDAGLVTDSGRYEVAEWPGHRTTKRVKWGLVK